MKKALFITLILSFLFVGSALAQDALPKLSDLDQAWNQILLSGDAICARGTPYSFFVHPADPDKLVIYFQGGGACWNADTCKAGGTFDDSVSADELDRYAGIFDFTNPENPVADDSFVVVAYCTGDVHTGAATQNYTVGAIDFSIDFNGFANTQAVLDWTYANFESPSEVIVTGSSAGAYGASFNAPYILDHYADSHLVVFGDAGIGVTAPDWEGLTAWNSAVNVPDYVSAAPGAALNDQLYAALADRFPDGAFAEYTSFSDQIQTGFYTLQGGASEDWVVGMQNSLTALDALPNFHSYIGWGVTHTVLATPLFYEMQVGGVRFRDWFASLIDDGTVENIACDDCQAQELYSAQ